MISAFGVEHGFISKVSDETKHRAEDIGAGAAAAGAGQGAYQAAGYGTKHYADRRTRRGTKLGSPSPEQVKLQDKVLKPAKKAYGMGLPQSDPARNNLGYHRNYPKELPHARKIRTLGHTHEGKSGVALGAAATVGSALAGGLLTRRHNEG